MFVDTRRTSGMGVHGLQTPEHMEVNECRGNTRYAIS